MSVEQLEEGIRQLSDEELARLTKWFGAFLARRVSIQGASASSEWTEPPELFAELELRRAQAESDPGIITEFEPDYFETLRRRISDEHSRPASAS